MNDATPKAIQDEKEYSNLLAVRENIVDLANYCFGIYGAFDQTLKNDEAKNAALKYEYRQYAFKRQYSTGINITISNASYKSTHYNEQSLFDSAVAGNYLQGLSALEIKLNLSFRRGPDTQTVDHNHEFIIEFRPNGCNYRYVANFDDPLMNSVRDNIAAKLAQFPVANTIFTKVDNG